MNDGAADSVEWSVTGDDLVELDEETLDDTTLSLTAGEAAGKVTLTAQVESDGVICMASFEFSIVGIEFLDAQEEEATFLNIGHWGEDVGGNQLSGYDPVTNQVINGPNVDTFIDTDPDRFYVKVTDFAANADRDAIDTMTVTIATTGPHADDATEITLTETGKRSNQSARATTACTSR